MENINKMIEDKQLTDVDLFFTTGEVFIIHEWETWTDKMKRFYRSKIGDDAFRKMKEDIMAKHTQVIGEVAEDACAHATFMTQNNVSADVDTAMAHVLSSDVLTPYNSVQ